MNLKRIDLKTKRFSVLIILLLSFTITVFGQNIRIKVEAPETILEGEQFKVNYKIESDREIREAIIIKNMEGFTILYGPAVSTSRSVTINKGKRETTYITNSVYYLEAVKKGKYALPRAEITVEGKKYKSETAKIDVKSLGEDIDEIEAFVKTIVSKNSVNISDTLTLTYRLYTTKDIRRILSVNIPGNREFYSQNITSPRQYFKEETLNGKKYQAADIRVQILQPRNIGQYIIPEGEVILEYAIPTGRKVQDMWGDVYDETVRKEKTLDVEPVTIRVQDLKEI
ncbi:MAG: BatD family protein [Dysgonomonas sp.]|nr:BatD family protein [Dysgonomonas sp.]